MAEQDLDIPPPDQPGQPLARAALQRRKRRDAALAMPLVGVFLLASPFLNVLVGAGELFGVPASALYLFGVWFVLIALTAALSRRLVDDDGTG